VKKDIQAPVKRSKDLPEYITYTEQ